MEHGQQLKSHGPPPGNIDSGNFAYFDGAVIAPHAVTAASGETSINSVQFVTGGWTINGNPVTQDFYTYGISSSGPGTNTINIGISARDVVPAVFTIGAGNTIVINGLVGAVRNNGGLVKNGGGTLILTHTNSYSGATSVNDGGLLVMAALAARSAVTVAPGGTLGGNGVWQLRFAQRYDNARHRCRHARDRPGNLERWWAVPCARSIRQTAMVPIT